jgi:hypothetical protein
VREACRQVISKNLGKTSHSQSENHNKVIKSLRRKDCFYLKADKGNKVLILDKEDYYERVNHLISNGPYQVINKNPLPGMIRDINDVLKTCSHLVTPGIRYDISYMSLTPLFLNYTVCQKFINLENLRDRLFLQSTLQFQKFLNGCQMNSITCP